MAGRIFFAHSRGDDPVTQAKRDLITRRAVLSSVAALPAAALSASTERELPLASSSMRDPIFASIEAHIDAHNELVAAVDKLVVAEEAARSAPRGLSHIAKRQLAEAYEAERHFSDLRSDAADRLVATVPTTLRGLMTAVRYVLERQDLDYPLWDDRALTLIASMEETLARAANLPGSRINS
jgi:hypothetical protein